MQESCSSKEFHSKEPFSREKLAYFKLGLLLSTFVPGLQDGWAQVENQTTSVKFFSGAASTRLPSSGLNPDQKSLGEIQREKAFRLNEEGVEQVFKGNRGQGLEKLIQAFELDPENTTVLYNLAGVYLSQSNPKEAILLMEKAVLLSPTDLAFLNRLAESHFADSNLSRAIECYEKIIEKNIAYGKALLRLGTLYGMKREWDKAESTLNKAVEMHPSDADALSNLGNVLVIRKKYPEAIVVLQKSQAIKKSAGNAVALGIAHESSGNNKEALTHFEQAKILGDPDPSLEKHIIEIRKSLGQE